MLQSTLTKSIKKNKTESSKKSKSAGEKPPVSSVDSKQEKLSQPKSKSKELTPESALLKKRAKREILYPEIEVRIFDSKNPLTVEEAKELLGWRLAIEKSKQGVFVLGGERIVLTNNNTNRPINASVLVTLQQEHLRKRWCFNGEPIIIGKTGQVLNGQHSLISLVLAAQDWEKHPGKWKLYWQAEPTMTKLIVFGVSEDDIVVNTIDTAKSRVLWEVIYRSEIFADVAPSQRRPLSRICDQAAKLIWARTGITRKRTHAEFMDFIKLHPRIIECAKHMYIEDGNDHKITRYLGPGLAAGLLYLMGSSRTKLDDYFTLDIPSEEPLSWSLWDKACRFWSLLAQAHTDLIPVRYALSDLYDQGNNTVAERIGVIAKAWLEFLTGKGVTQEAITLEYSTDGDGNRRLLEFPVVGGIDCSTYSEAKDAKEEETERKSKKKELKSAKAKSSKAPPIPPAHGTKAGAEWAEGDTAWVYDRDGEHYFGILAEDPYQTDQGEWHVDIIAGDKRWDTLVTALQLDRPKPKPVS